MREVVRRVEKARGVGAEDGDVVDVVLVAIAVADEEDFDSYDSPVASSEDVPHIVFAAVSHYNFWAFLRQADPSPGKVLS